MCSDPIPYDVAMKLFQRLDKGHLIYEYLPDGTRVSVQKKKKPYAVMINSFGFELLPGRLRLFKWEQGARVALQDPKRQAAVFAKRFQSVCRRYGVLKKPVSSACPKPTRAQVARAGVALELSKLLLWYQSPRARTIAQQRLQLACLDPEAYLERRRDALGERGIHEVTPELPVLALVDVLLSAHALSELDWRAEPREVKKALRRRIMSTELARVWPSAEDRPAAELLRAVGQKLPSVGKQLFLLDLRNDSLYPLVVRRENATEVARTLRRFGVKVKSRV
jgi:hypothetical protein